MATGGQEESIQIQRWGLGSVSSPPLLRLCCSGEPQPAHSPFLPPRLSSPEHTFGNVAVSTEANESADDGDCLHPVSFVSLPFLLHLEILRRDVSLRQDSRIS